MSQVSYFFYHTFFSCALVKVELSLYPKFPMCSPRCPKFHTSSIILLSHVLWLKLNFHCTPSSQCVPQDVTSIIVLLSYFYLMCFGYSWAFIVPQVPNLFPKMSQVSYFFYHTFISHALANESWTFIVPQVPNVFLKFSNVFPKFPLCSPTWHQVSYF
jgi:hypothetical protein